MCRRSVCLSRAVVRGEYKDSSGEVPELVEWSMTFGAFVFAAGETEGAGLLVPCVELE